VVTICVEGMTAVIVGIGLEDDVVIDPAGRGR